MPYNCSAFLKHLLLYICPFLLALPAVSQEFEYNTTPIRKNAIQIGGARQTNSAYYKYERLFHYKSAPWTKTVLNIGMGRISGRSEDSTKQTGIIHMEAGQLFGHKRFFVEVGLEFYGAKTGPVGYTGLNGIIGLRYYFVKGSPPQFCLLGGYNPKLWQSYDTNRNIPFYAGFGIVF